jgi:hypothetical protein
MQIASSVMYVDKAANTNWKHVDSKHYSKHQIDALPSISKQKTLVLVHVHGFMDVS